jgi:hypothetical protein
VLRTSGRDPIAERWALSTHGIAARCLVSGFAGDRQSSDNLRLVGLGTSRGVRCPTGL